MKKILIIALLFLSSCSTNDFKNNINFSDEMSFEEFRDQLWEYATNSPYPKIDD